MRSPVHQSVDQSVDQSVAPSLAQRHAQPHAQPHGPTLVTVDTTLRDDLARLAAAAGVPLRVVESAVEALPWWSAPPVVLVGADLAAEVALLRPPRRSGVHVVGWSGLADGTYRCALQLGAEQVLELPDAAEVLTDLLTDLGESARGEGRVVGVLGGSGGAGATTLACAVAQQHGRHGPAMVLDLDPWGPGADRVLGLDRAPGVRWADLAGGAGRLSGRALREAVPRRDGVGVLTWTTGTVATLPAAAVVREALSAARRGHDLVVVDLPRSADPLGREVQSRCALVALVVTPTVVGVAAAARVAAQVPDTGRLGVIVRASRRSTADPERVAAAVGAPLLTVMTDQRGLVETVDLGLGPIRSHRGPLARACRQVLAA